VSSAEDIYEEMADLPVVKDKKAKIAAVQTDGASPNKRMAREFLPLLNVKALFSICGMHMCGRIVATLMKE